MAHGGCSPNSWLSKPRPVEHNGRVPQPDLDSHQRLKQMAARPHPTPPEHACAPGDSAQTWGPQHPGPGDAEPRPCFPLLLRPCSATVWEREWQERGSGGPGPGMGRGPPLWDWLVHPAPGSEHPPRGSGPDTRLDAAALQRLLCPEGRGLVQFTGDLDAQGTFEEYLVARSCMLKTKQKSAVPQHEIKSKLIKAAVKSLRQAH